MSFVNIEDIDIQPLESLGNQSSGTGLHIVVTYKILPLRINDRMNIVLKV
jgi:hypothetical protein